MSKLPVMDALQGHPFDGHLAGRNIVTIVFTGNTQSFLSLIFMKLKKKKKDNA